MVRNDRQTIFSESIVVGTHATEFHCDDTLAIFMLSLIFPKLKLKRTNNPNELTECDMLIDTGGVYDPYKLRFDHHQHDFFLTMSDLKCGIYGRVKLSSAGLIYAEFGRKIIETILQRFDPTDRNQIKLEFVYKRAYNSFIKEVDGQNNFIPTGRGPPRFLMRTNICSRIENMNPAWNEDVSTFDYDGQFSKAVELIGSEFEHVVLRVAHVVWDAREVVRMAIINRFHFHESGAAVYLEPVCPWKELFFELEREMHLPRIIRYIIFKRDTENHYKVMAIPIQNKLHQTRKSFPFSWRGLNDTEFANLTGVEDAVFAHKEGFIAGVKSLEGAKKLMELALESPEVPLTPILNDRPPPIYRQQSLYGTDKRYDNYYKIERKKEDFEYGQNPYRQPYHQNYNRDQGYGNPRYDQKPYGNEENYDRQPYRNRDSYQNRENYNQQPPQDEEDNQQRRSYQGNFYQRSYQNRENYNQQPRQEEEDIQQRRSYQGNFYQRSHQRYENYNQQTFPDRRNYNQQPYQNEQNYNQQRDQNQQNYNQQRDQNQQNYNQQPQQNQGDNTRAANEAY